MHIIRCRCEAGNIVIVNGSQHAFDLLARLLINPGNAVVMERLGYIGAQHLFVTHQARLQLVAVDKEGIQVAQLGTKYHRPKLVYVIPSHQFPTGVVMSLARRVALIQWARKHDAYIIEDDYDSKYRYDSHQIECVQELDAYDARFMWVPFRRFYFPLRGWVM